MSVPAVRRIVVGVDTSAESVAALRWACREASFRGAEVHAVHVREELCHSLASYAVPAISDTDEVSVEDVVHEVHGDYAPDVKLRVEMVDGLAARVLLDRCGGAEMLILGTSSDEPGSPRSAGPVIRACLRRASCPVVVINEAMAPSPRKAARAEARVPVAAGV